MDALTTYYESAFAANAEGNIYRPFTRFERLSHERRVELLSALPLPPLESATVVDYGVGSWGFGCIFPRLKQAARAIGIDISERAVALSREISARDPELLGKQVTFMTATGYDLQLPDSSVDLFFAGECIEHIDDTECFLEEVHRVLKVRGMAIFTTPNASPTVYRNLGLRWCVGFEHSALMDHATFRDRLAAYFGVELMKGFNQSLLPSVDEGIDEASARAWVSACENTPEDATGLIALVRKTHDHRPSRARVVTVESTSLPPSSECKDVPIVPGYTGRMIMPDHEFEVTIPAGARRCSLIFWSHTWSGTALITSESKRDRVDLYSHAGGCMRHVLDCVGMKSLKIRALPEKRPDSESYEVIFLRAVFAVG
jgi:SAM-dependent methyltransferase